VGCERLGAAATIAASVASTAARITLIA
jgi:hypothetical protein